MSRSSFWVRGSGSLVRRSVGFRSVVGLALSSGCCSWSLRGSFRSFTGSVVWALFVCPVVARSFARSASVQVGVVVCVRPGWCSSSGFVWVVSVPVVR